MKDNPWNPFEDRLAFDWAHYHFVELQSSEREINKGLDLWQAAMVKAGNDTPLPWSSVEESIVPLMKSKKEMRHSQPFISNILDRFILIPHVG